MGEKLYVQHFPAHRHPGKGLLIHAWVTTVLILTGMDRTERCARESSHRLHASGRVHDVGAHRLLRAQAKVGMGDDAKKRGLE